MASSQEGVNSDLERVVMGCLEKIPENRPRTAGELREQLLSCDGVERWSHADARAWWKRYGPDLQGADEPKPATAQEQTLAMDPRGREG